MFMILIVYVNLIMQVHYLFLKYKLSKKKSARWKYYNFKRANWKSLTYDLRHTNWIEFLLSNDVEMAWATFKKHIFYLIDKHILKITVKPDFQPPWFDSEVYSLCRQKARLRKKFKNSKSDSDEIKFSNAPREFKKFVSKQ